MDFFTLSNLFFSVSTTELDSDPQKRNADPQPCFKLYCLLRITSNCLQIYIDGPFGSPSSNIYRAEHAVLIGTGIGITPFASILQSIMHR